MSPRRRAYWRRFFTCWTAWEPGTLSRLDRQDGLR